jgi:hypothetical protein
MPSHGPGTHPQAGTSLSPATFIVLGDGKELWQSKKITHNHARSQDFQIIVKGVDVLELRVQAK